MTPSEGTLYGLGIANTRSGLMFHPSAGNSLGAGLLVPSPSAAPLSAQRASILISASDSLRSFEKWPYLGSANQGGIFLISTAVLIALAHGRTSLYVRNDMGAIWLGRWQLWQLFWRM